MCIEGTWGAERGGRIKGGEGDAKREDKGKRVWKGRKAGQGMGYCICAFEYRCIYVCKWYKVIYLCNYVCECTCLYIGVYYKVMDEIMCVNVAMNEII